MNGQMQNKVENIFSDTGNNADIFNKVRMIPDFPAQSQSQRRNPSERMVDA